MDLGSFLTANYKLAEPMLILFFSVIVFCLVTSYIQITRYSGNVRNTTILLPLYYIISFFSFFILLNKLQAATSILLTSFTFIFQMFMFIYHITLLVLVKMEYEMDHIHLFVTKFLMTLCLLLSILDKKKADDNESIENLEMFSKFIIFAFLIFTYIYIFYESIRSTHIS